MNSTAANEHGFLARGDIDCAVSKPNALHNIPTTYRVPSVIRSNATALATFNLTGYFDIISLSFKPLGPAPQFTHITVDAWKIDGKQPTYVDGMFSSWQEQTGFLRPVTVYPNEYWPGWGQNVNWIEIEARTGDDERWEFCVDNIVLRFHKEGEGKGDNNRVRA